MTTTTTRTLPNTLPSEQEMYRALCERDASYDGIFFACVRTTGIFCRPVCRARKPHRRNVEFVATARDALVAGYRPCRVCAPTSPDERRPAWVRELMDRVERQPGERITEGTLRAMDIDPARARRYFKQHFGLTFHAWHRARRLGGAVRALREGGDITTTGLDHGFDSTSGFRDAFARLFGAPPGRSRDAACLLGTALETPLGPMLAIVGDRGLILLEFFDRRAIESQIATVRRRFDAVIVPGRNEHTDQVETELTQYFAGDRRAFDTPLDAPGTPFQQATWDQLQRIGYGTTRSYAELATAIDRPGASRAIGRANGMNRIAIIVPCHRVIRADGSLCGYGGGLWRKKWLLEHEKRHVGRA